MPPQHFCYRQNVLVLVHLFIEKEITFPGKSGYKMMPLDLMTDLPSSRRHVAGRGLVGRAVMMLVRFSLVPGYSHLLRIHSLVNSV